MRRPPFSAYGLGRTPATHVAPPRGWLLSSTFLAVVFRVHGEVRPGQQEANPNVGLGSITDPLRGSRRPDAGVRPDAQHPKGGRCTTRTSSLDRETGSARMRSIRRGDVAQHKPRLRLVNPNQETSVGLSPARSAGDSGRARARGRWGPSAQREGGRPQNKSPRQNAKHEGHEHSALRDRSASRHNDRREAKQPERLDRSREPERHKDGRRG